MALGARVRGFCLARVQNSGYPHTQHVRDLARPACATTSLLRPSDTKMASPHGNNDAGRMILTNATPYAWRRSLNKPKGMKVWTFPIEIAPGASVVCLVAFKGGNGAHGQASYQVCDKSASVKCFGPRDGYHILLVFWYFATARRGDLFCRLNFLCAKRIWREKTKKTSTQTPS